MKKRLILPILSILMLTCSQQAKAANFYMSPASGTVAPGGTLNVELKLNSTNTNNYNLDSAVSIVTFDSSLVSLSASNGTFFPNLSVDSSTTNELALTGTLNFGDLLGVSGDQTFATLTLTPQASSGTINLSYRCSASDRNDSNIMALITGTSDTINLLNTDTACGTNVGGSYTIGDSSTPTATPTPTTTSTSATATPKPTTVSSNSSSTSTTTQLVTPTTLPQSGPKDWLMAFPVGIILVILGILAI